MKITKVILTAAAALGFCALQASASIGVTVQPSHFNASITVITNKPTTVSGAVTHWGVASAAIGNKQLLDLFAKWNSIVPRSGDPVWKNAKLVVGNDWDGDILVVDQTGTNVLFDATEGIDDASFEVEFHYEEGEYTENDKDASPGYDDWNENYQAYYQLFDETFSPEIDLWGYGSDQQNFAQNWNTEVYTTWSDTENAVFPLQGDQLLNDFFGSAKASFGASGSGKGESDLY